MLELVQTACTVTQAYSISSTDSTWVHSGGNYKGNQALRILPVSPWYHLTSSTQLEQEQLCCDFSVSPVLGTCTQHALMCTVRPKEGPETAGIKYMEFRWSTGPPMKRQSGFVLICQMVSPTLDEPTENYYKLCHSTYPTEHSSIFQLIDFVFFYEALLLLIYIRCI